MHPRLNLLSEAEITFPKSSLLQTLADTHTHTHMQQNTRHKDVIDKNHLSVSSSVASFAIYFVVVAAASTKGRAGACTCASTYGSAYYRREQELILDSVLQSSLTRVYRLRLDHSGPQ